MGEHRAQHYNADGWDDDGWDDFESSAKTPSKLGSPANAGGERKLTKMELAQLKKEEQAKRRPGSK